MRKPPLTANEAARQSHHAAVQVPPPEAYAETIADEHIRLEALIKASRDGVIFVDMGRHIRVMNGLAVELLRLPGSPEDWIDRRIEAALRALWPHAPGAVRVALAELRRIGSGTGPSAEGEAEISPRVVHWSSLPVSAGSTALGRLIVLRDVTEERLLQTLREDLTRTMVHDLRNPLTGIRGALDVLAEDGPLSPLQQEMLEIARSSTQQLLVLVSAILEVSRLESGQMLASREPVVLRELVGEMLQMQAPLVAAKRQRLDNRVPADLPPVVVDAGLIRRVVQNLVGNAIKFTPAGGAIQVSARPGEGSDGPGWLLLTVRDNGPGIPPEIRGRLFQKFVTGPHLERGSGLGLAFCRLAVEAHGGRIWLDGEPGQGTALSFTLPVLENE